MVCGTRHPPQTNKNAGRFQGVSVSVSFLYNQGEAEKELFERPLVGCYGRIVEVSY